ncbi:hypothetical protein ACP4OV_006996 [Aristida adscensionis]
MHGWAIMERRRSKPCLLLALLAMLVSLSLLFSTVHGAEHPAHKDRTGMEETRASFSRRWAPVVRKGGGGGGGGGHGHGHGRGRGRGNGTSAKGPHGTPGTPAAAVPKPRTVAAGHRGAAAANPGRPSAVALLLAAAAVPLFHHL